MNKVLKVDFTYTLWAYDGEKVRLRDMQEDTGLLPRKDAYNVEKTAFVFPTECFFAVHKAILTGTRVIHDKLLELNKEISRLKSLYDDSKSQALGSQGQHALEALGKQLNALMSKWVASMLEALVACIGLRCIHSSILLCSIHLLVG